MARAPGQNTPLGCDLELRPLPRAAARLVLREDEEGLLGAGSRPAGAAWTVTELFSAKEAAWKALTGPWAMSPDGPRGLRPDGPDEEFRFGPDDGGLDDPQGERLDGLEGERLDDPRDEGLDGPEGRRRGGSVAGGPGHRDRDGSGGRRGGGPAGGLRDLRVCAAGGDLLVCTRADPARVVRVRVLPVGAGVFSYVLGRG
ncbi:hypothetical protein ACVV2G_17100 [Streptomyces ziwulingensis]